jgi:hypothetical protein
MVENRDEMANTPQTNAEESPSNEKSQDTEHPAAAREELLSGPDETDPVSRAYARTGRQDTTGISGLPAYDEDAGEERKKLYKEGAEIVSRID